MFWNVMTVSLMGGILCLDRIFLQVMISRPVVAGPVVGLMLHDPLTGLLCGALIELFWIDRLPIGTYIPPNDSITTVIVTAAAILAWDGVGHPSREFTVFTMLVLLPLGYAGQQLDTRIVHFNERISKEAVRLAEQADIRGIVNNHWLGLIRSFGISVTFIFVALYLSIGALSILYPLIPHFVHRAMTLCYYGLPLLGIAIALTTIKRQGAVTFFSVAFVAFMVIWKWMEG